MNNKAFTLAEVLITLGIIGVVAVLTLPTLFNNHRKYVLHKQFLKVYSDLSNASKLFEVHEDISVHDFSKTNESNYNSNKTLETFMKYYRGKSQRVNRTPGMSSDNPDYKPMYSDILGYDPKSLGGTTIDGLIRGTPCDESGAIQNISGAIFLMDNSLTGTYANITAGPKICVDTNGKNPPNTFGYDWFVFIFMPDGSVVPYTQNSITGYGTELSDKSAYCNYAQKNATYTCAYYALQDISPVDSTKTYWKDFLK